MRMKKWRGGGDQPCLLLWRSSGKECLQPPVHTISSVDPRGTSNKAVLSGIRSSLRLWLQPEQIALTRPFVVRKWEIMLFLRDVDNLKMKRNVRFDEMLYPSGDDVSIEQNCLRFLKEILFSDEEGNGHKLWLNHCVLKTKKRWKWLLLLLFAQTILMSRSHLICVCGLWSL